MQRNIAQFTGCMLGGAIGDALGYPVEFMKLSDILTKYPPRGISSLITSSNGHSVISDDTQMSIFTAEGLLRANSKSNTEGICNISSVVHNAYIRWLHTQGLSAKGRQVVLRKLDGHIIKEKGLFNRRAPGNTCLLALSSGKMGTRRYEINSSKGCGGVMRVAPVGLLFEKEQAFEIGCDIAAITHGHPSGYIPAGALAYIISSIVEGLPLNHSILGAYKMAATTPGGQECATYLKNSLKLHERRVASIDALKVLGTGWTGEEALSISCYCALSRQNNFREALILSVNHDGDSDSTGSITGSILGTYLGIQAIPQDWLEAIELKQLLYSLSNDLYMGFEDSDDWLAKYPSW